MSRPGIFLFVFTVVCQVLPAPAGAQGDELSPRKDFQFWPSLTLQAPLAAKWEASLQQELRLDENVSEFKQTFSEATLLWKTNDFLRLAGNYRFIITSRAIRHRISGQFSLRYSIERLRLTYRGRLQREYERDEIPDNYFRQKLTLQYNLKGPVNPFVATEWYYHIWYKENQFDKMRIDIGADVNLKKGHSLSLFYRIQKEFNVNDPLTAGIIGLGYSFSLNVSKDESPAKNQE